MPSMTVSTVPRSSTLMLIRLWLMPLTAPTLVRKHTFSPLMNSSPVIRRTAKQLAPLKNEAVISLALFSLSWTLPSGMISTSALVSAPVRTRLPSRIRMSLPEAGCLALSTKALPPSTYMVAMTLSCACATGAGVARDARIAGSSEEHTSEIQSPMRISYAVFRLEKKKITTDTTAYVNPTKQIHDQNKQCQPKHTDNTNNTRITTRPFINNIDIPRKTI